MAQDEEEQGAVKFQRPRILLLDMATDVADRLTHAGYNVTTGSLGRPYSVPVSSDYFPVINNHSLADFKEQEVVIVDFGYSGTDDGPDGEQQAPIGEVDVYAKQTRGIVDPRARLVPALTKDFDRCLQHGAWFIVLAHPAIDQELVVTQRMSYGHSGNMKAYTGRIWQLTSALSNVGVERDRGKEMHPLDSDSAIGKLTAEYLKNGEFTCTLSSPAHWSDIWKPLAKNKYGQTVGAMVNFQMGGGLVLLPRLANVAQFIEQLFSEVLPDLAPQLFPDAEKRGWTHEPVYELTRVTQLMETQEAVIVKAKQELADLNKQIASERALSGWMHDLLTGTGDVLVKAVVKAFNEIGLKKIIDVDEELDKDGVSRREDLQVHDSSPTLVIDVKGLGGHPSDADAFQSHKHATLRLQEWKRFDVQALTIINHQRHLPPIGRDNLMPFRQEILDFADEMKMGLLTTWDLYRLVRSKQSLRWSTEHTASALYHVGRIQPIPSHYVALGVVHHVYTGVVSIQVNSDELKISDRIAFETDIVCIEQVVDSMQVDKTPLEIVGAGVKVGVTTKFGRPTLKEGMRVFVVRDVQQKGST
ncbi:MAG: hypothetical protein ABI432_17715 [Flavobacteriales bacterium]